MPDKDLVVQLPPAARHRHPAREVLHRRHLRQQGHVQGQLEAGGGEGEGPGEPEPKVRVVLVLGWRGTIDAYVKITGILRCVGMHKKGLVMRLYYSRGG